MSRPSLFDSFLRYLAGQGYDVPADMRDRDVSPPLEASAAVQQVLKKVYDDDTDATAVCELLVDLDEGMQEWRYHHIKMVERTIGARRGTGGSAGATYLRTTLGHPDLPRSVGDAEPGIRTSLPGAAGLAGMAGRDGGGGYHGPFGRKVFYSHSMVAGGLLVTSRTTRLTSGTSLVTRVEIRASTSAGSRAQSAVMASSLVTGRSTSGWP